MIAVSREHRTLVKYDQALRTPLTRARRIAMVQLHPHCGATTTANQVAAAFARRRSDGDVVVTDWGVRRHLDWIAAISDALCLVAPTDPVAVSQALEALTVVPDDIPRVLVLVEIDPIGWALRRRLCAIAEVPTVLIGHERALRLHERHRPARLPYPYRVAHLRLAALLMRAEPVEVRPAGPSTRALLSLSKGSGRTTTEVWSWDLP